MSVSSVWEPKQLVPKEIGQAVVKYLYSDVGVFVPDKEGFNFNKLKLEHEVTFQQEPKNRFDNRTVAVYFKKRKIGYLRKGKEQDKVNQWIENGDPIVAIISLIGLPDAQHHGTVYLFLAFYK